MNNPTFYPQNDYRYLAHHGVKGMKWGVRHEQARKARIMKDYGITSKQYDKVKAETAKRHRKGNKAKAVASSVVHTLSIPRYINAAGAPFEGVDRYHVGMASGSIIGTMANIGLTQATVSIPWKIGRGITDSIIEYGDFKEMAKENNRKRGN